MSKTFGEMTPEERQAAIDRATAQLTDELRANADAIGRIMDEAITDGHWPNAVTVPEFNNRTVIACECGAKPKKPAARMSMQHVWHQTHRRGLKLQPVEYIWPDDRYLQGLSTGGYVQVKHHEWRDGGWVVIPK